MPVGSLLLLAVVVAAGAADQRAKPIARRPSAADELRQRIEQVLALPAAARSHWGIQVVRLDTGETLYSLNGAKFFTPASNTKLFSTALALDALGPDFRFRTTVEAAGLPDRHGRITGDLELVGRGDPNLSSRVLPYAQRTEREGNPLKALDALADQVVAKGVRYIDGKLIADDSYFIADRFGDGWAYDDLGYWYGAPISALTINDNVLFLEVLPAEQAGLPAFLKLEPWQDYYRLENRVVTVPARGQSRLRRPEGDDLPPGERRIAISRDPGSYRLEVRGRIPVDDGGAKYQVPMEDPALFAAKYLRQALLQRGVVVYGEAEARHSSPLDFERLEGPYQPPPAPSRVVLAQYESVPLEQDLRVTNKVSHNLHAEILLRTVARERRGIGSAQAGMEEMKALLARAGVQEEEYLLFDGSGLSRRNLVTPGAIVTLLRYMDAHRHSAVWHDSLPVAGVDGSLSERLRKTPAEGRIQAKTGSLGNVRALSGYVTTVRGGRLAFSLMMNHFSVRGTQASALLDRICVALAEADIPGNQSQD